MKKLILVFVFIITFVGCTSKKSESSSPDYLKLKVHKNSSVPFLTKDGAHLWLTWIENYGTKKSPLKRLMVSRFDHDGWSPPVVINDSPHLMVNWADFPSLQKGGDGNFYAHWLERVKGEKNHGYHVYAGRSTDGGKTWNPLGRVHNFKDASNEYFGFATMQPIDTGVQIFWLDGRSAKGHGGSMQLRTAELNEKVINENVVDTNVCNCCGMDSVKFKGQPVVFYRDRTKDEIRDISAAHFSDGKWIITNISNDQWKIHGCPVNGPSADELNGSIVVSWYSGGGQGTGVKVAFSKDGGFSFSESYTADDFVTGSLGRNQVILLSEFEAVVSWMKSKPDGKADLYARRVYANGKKGEPTVIAEIKGSRGVGFPQMQRLDNKLYFVWTQGGSSEYESQGLVFKSVDIKFIPKHGDDPLKNPPVVFSGYSKGEYVSEFESQDLKGQNHKLSDFRGQPLLLNFWASWCKACVEEFGYINKLKKQFGSKGLKIITVNVDDADGWELAQKQIKQAKLSSLILRDQKNLGRSKFGYSALPFTAVITPELKLQWTHTGSLIPEKSKLEKLLNGMLKPSDH